MIETLSEGLGRPNQLPSLRLEADTLLDWLVARKQLPARWRRNKAAVQKAVEDALAAGAAGEDSAGAAHLRNLAHIGYYDLQAALDALAKAEPAARSLLGRYTSPRLKALDDACRVFRRGKYHIGDAAEELQQLLRHDAREARDLIAHDNERCAWLSGAIERDEARLERLREEFNSACAEWGVASESSEDEMQRQLEEAPLVALAALLNGVLPCFGEEETSQKAPVEELVECYDEFRRFTWLWCSEQESQQKEVDDECCLVVLRAALKTKGMGVDEAVRVLAKCCGSDESEVLQRVHRPKQQPKSAKDFGIVLEEEGFAGEEATQDKSTCLFEGLHQALLHDKLLRVALVNELWEIKEFLAQRRAEQAESTQKQMMLSANTAVDYFAAAGHIVPALEHAEQHQHTVETLLHALEGTQARRLLEVLESARVREAVARRLANMRASAEKQQQSMDAHRQCLADMDSTIAEHRSQLDVIAARARFLTQAIRKDLEAMFPNRDITILLPQ